MQVISNATELHKAMQVEHAYYMSTQDGDTHACVDDFISNWRDYDIDLNHVIRWDFVKQTDDYPEEIRELGPVGSTYCRVVFVMPRKGYLFSNVIKNVKTHETPKLLAFLKKHWEYMQSQWGPVPEIDYIANTTPQSEFLTEIKRITDRRALNWYNQLLPILGDNSDQHAPSKEVDRAVVTTIQQVVGDVLELIDKGIPGVNNGYALFPYDRDGTMGPIEDVGDVDIGGNLAEWYFNSINN
jgi:ribosomal protein S18